MAPAALVFSPPNRNSMTIKFHICDQCWPAVALFVQGIGTRLIVGRRPKPSLNPILYPKQ
jgi:hypothetical protein